MYENIIIYSSGKEGIKKNTQELRGNARAETESKRDKYWEGENIQDGGCTASFEHVLRKCQNFDSHLQVSKVL